MTVLWIFAGSFTALDILIHSHHMALAQFLHMTTLVTFERSEYFFLKKLQRARRDSERYCMGEWKKGRKWYNEWSSWRTSRPEVFFWLKLLARFSQ